MLRNMPRLQKVTVGNRFIVRATTQPGKEWVFKVKEFIPNQGPGPDYTNVTCFLAVMEGDDPQIVAFDIYGIAVTESPDTPPVGYYVATEPPPPEGYGIADAVPLLAKD